MRVVPHAQSVPENACVDIAESLSLCFSCGDAPITETQRQAWQLSPEQLLAHVRTTTAPAVSAAHFQREEVVDSPGHVYWVSASQDGLDAAGLLHPDALRQLIGGEVVVGVPGRGVLIAWIPGDPELDTMVAVGIANMHEQAANPISDKVYFYRDGEWVVWGEARRTEPL